MVMFEVKRAVLGIRMSGSVAPDITFSILTCMCVVARNDQQVVTGIGCCTDEHADMLRGLLTPGSFRSHHRRGFLFNIGTR
jgi:hypothetical protein